VVIVRKTRLGGIDSRRLVLGGPCSEDAATRAREGTVLGGRRDPCSEDAQPQGS
jgi:hypothetical protein